MISSSETRQVYSLSETQAERERKRTNKGAKTDYIVLCMCVCVWMYSKTMNAEKAVLHFWNKFVQSSLFVWMKTLNDFIECIRNWL